MIFSVYIFCDRVVILFSFETYLAVTAFARKIVAFAVHPVKQFLRIRSFVAIADATLARAVAATYLSSLIVGFAIDHRDRFSTELAFLAFAVISIIIGIARTHAAHGCTTSIAFYCIRLISLCRKLWFKTCCKVINMQIVRTKA